MHSLDWKDIPPLPQRSRAEQDGTGAKEELMYLHPPQPQSLSMPEGRGGGDPGITHPTPGKPCDFQREELCPEGSSGIAKATVLDCDQN